METDAPIKKPTPVRINHYVLVLVMVWTFICLLLILYEYFDKKEQIIKSAENQARANFNKDQAFRHWAASHGGVYVPITENTQPNKYLSHIPNRDIYTTDSVALTLMNPAYMVRQMNEYFKKYYGIGAHITSLTPLRPENAPDAWEEMALKRFEQGEIEITEIIETDSGTNLRLMQPMFVEQSCLKCHAHQGYKKGDIRGGVSVSFPIDEIIAIEKNEFLRITISVIILWLLATIGIFIAHKRINLKISEKYKTELLLTEINQDLTTKEEELRASNEELQTTSEALEISYNDLWKAKEKAEESNKLKSAFLANMSHEIRTPLNGILGFLNLLLSDKITPEKASQYLKYINISSSQLLRIMSNILDMAVIETTQLILMNKTISLHNFLSEIENSAKEYRRELDSEHIEFVINNNVPETDFEFVFDKVKLTQILINLIHNAIKFTNEGKVIVDVNIIENEEDKRLQFVITDTGIGIAQKNYDFIFENFNRIDNQNDKKVTGTGLGLSICKKLAEKLNAKLYFTSVENEGSVFYFEFSVKPIITNEIEENTTF